MSFDLRKLHSPILLQGNANTAYRDPCAMVVDGIAHLFFTVVETEPDGRVFMYLGASTSTDFVDWTPPRLLTQRNQSLNFSSPGNVIRHNGEYVLCLQTYPRENGEKYANGNARLWTMRSKDLVTWSEPELMRVKGPDIEMAEMGRMIDPYLVVDKDDRELVWCFFKQNGASLSSSRDLALWEYHGYFEAGENVCVVVDNGRYILFHSPENGIGIKVSTDLRQWQDRGVLTLGQENWPWAQGRITAGHVVDLRAEPGVGAYVMFFHGTGPEDESVIFDTHASIGIAWSEDLINWQWPGQ